jgi:hypothetical protein
MALVRPELSSIFEFYRQPLSWAQIVARKASGSYEAFAIDKPNTLCSTFASGDKSPEDVRRGRLLQSQ